MKKWEILGKRSAKGVEEIIQTLLKNRGLTSANQIKEFLNPPNPYTSSGRALNPKPLGINPQELSKAAETIKKAISLGEKIIVYGDFDADGICGTAILWETIHRLGGKVLPYIPHRIEEGYGLSQKGIDNLLSSKPSLIITVDHGITAAKAVEYAKKHRIEVIITDHHLPPKNLPQALAIVHTTQLSGAGVAWMLAKELISEFRVPSSEFLDLVAIGTIADLSLLIGPNRTLVKFGLRELNQTQRVGLLALIQEAGLELGKIGVYEVGHILAPRLNATGRITHALDSLRLLCTKNERRAYELAQKLGEVNRERQKLTEETVEHARSVVGESLKQKLIFISSESYNQGVIGLVAGKLVEEHYLPVIVVSKGKVHSKASARSINGFNIVEVIRECSDILVEAGGHPMAAGFTIETRYLKILKSRLEEIAQRELTEEKLKKVLKIDCEIDLEEINWELYDKISQFSPFGIGNPEPVFLTSGVEIKEVRPVGIDGKHLKLAVSRQPLAISFDAIAFGFGSWAAKIEPGDKLDIVYNLLADSWNGQEKLQLKIKDLTLSLPKGQ